MAIIIVDNNVFKLSTELYMYMHANEMPVLVISICCHQDVSKQCLKMSLLAFLALPCPVHFSMV